MQRFILVETWLDYLAEKGRGHCTIENYRAKLSRCLTTLEELGCSTDPRQINDKDILLLNRNLPGLCEQSRRDYLKVLNYWIEWYTGRDELSKCDILWNKTMPNRVFINEDKFKRLMEVSDARDRVILLLGGAMGLRREEIRTVRWSDIKDGQMMIHGKGHGPDGKVAWMHIPPVLMAALEEWRKQVVNNGKDDLSGGCIVISYQKAGMKQMAPTSVSHHVREIGKRAGVRVTVHSLRRLFATSLYKSNVDLVDIKQLMRHSNVNTTVNCYIEPFSERLDGIMENVIGKSLFISDKQ